MWNFFVDGSYGACDFACAPPLCCCDSRWGDYRRAGREVMGKGAYRAAAICGLAKNATIFPSMSSTLKAYRTRTFSEKSGWPGSRHPRFPASALAGRALRFPPDAHTMFAARLGAFGRGSVVAAQRRTFTIAFFVGLGDRRNGRPFAIWECTGADLVVAARLSHGLVTTAYDFGWRSDLRAAYAASSARNC